MARCIMLWIVMLNFAFNDIAAQKAKDDLWILLVDGA